ncbi:MAG: nicotinate-nucleotide adenylyltransferase [Syntrophomonadaceae bacterium]|jgi:nicotinate-nucleotide adenylyltransferase|nr:nicotinate-nucleotide adenylyltransferase [Syntrophomonadaceae bacterium]
MNKEILVSLERNELPLLKRIGLLGGTFDPIHYGHLVLAECARDELDLQKVFFIPAPRPPHKVGEIVLDSTHRYNMVRLAIRDNPFFKVSDLEMRRPGYSYTIDTVRYFMERWPETQLFFILGSDALLGIKTWKEAHQLMRLCNFIAAIRPGYKLDKDDEQLQDLPQEFWDHLHFIEVPGLYLSSTDLRERLATGKSVRYLLPPVVEEYIQMHHHYRSDNHHE